MRTGKAREKRCDGSSYELENAKTEHSLRAVPQRVRPGHKKWVQPLESCSVSFLQTIDTSAVIDCFNFQFSCCTFATHCGAELMACP